jgi:hypothetical protein
MKSETAEKKYMPEMPKKEIEELNDTVKSASIKIIADNIARMKKTDANRPAGMQYFDDVSNFFGQKSHWVFLRVCSC